jgi:membrane-associated phospholipid phosphatase
LLMAFIFWDSKPLRYIFIGWSVLFALTVLLGHLHYSIDVASAVFITYTIFHLSQIIFKKDFVLAKKECQ